MPQKKSYRQSLRRIKLLLMDVDGVLTDGGLYLSASGEEIKKFNVHDGYGIVKLQHAGVMVGIITGRSSALVEQRARQLGINELYQAVDRKIETYAMLKQKHSLADRQIAYIGDDEPDLEVLQAAGFSAAPADAANIVRDEVDYVCKKGGGEGAVREVIDLILRSRRHATDG